MSPTVAARMASTFDRISDGRLLINVVAGGDPVELQGDGLYLEHDERYEAADEFLKVWKSTLQGETISLEGKHMKVTDSKVVFRQFKRHILLYISEDHPMLERKLRLNIVMYI